MRNCILYFLTSLGLQLSIEIAAYGQISVKRVNPLTNPLVDSLVQPLAGAGIVIQNIKSNISESGIALGTVTDMGNKLGIRKGLVLLTGHIDSLPRPNGPNISGNSNNPTPSNPLSINLGGDTLPGASRGRSLLNTIVSQTPPFGITKRVRDVSSIEFEFVSFNDSVMLRYIFLSEGYPTDICGQFADICGIFLSGPGLPANQFINAQLYPNTVNVARIPGTNNHISVNTLNNGIPSEFNPESGCAFSPQGIANYISNQSPSSQLWNNLKFNGLSRVLTAKFKVVPLQTYRLIIAVGDVNDALYDSGVILEMGSLKPITEPSISRLTQFPLRFPYMIAGCNDGYIKFSKSLIQADSNVTIRFRQTGTAVNGIDYMLVDAQNNLSPVPDSIILPTGVMIDSIRIRGLAHAGFGLNQSKTVEFKLLDSKQPLLPNGQPNFINRNAALELRRRIQPGYQAVTNMCPLAYQQISPQNLPSDFIQYKWNRVAGTDTLAPEGLSCNDCRSPFVSVLASRVYSISVFDSVSTCTGAQSVRIELLSPPAAEPSTINDTVCKSTDATLRALGNGPFRWFFTPTGPGFIDNLTTNILSLSAPDTITTYYVSRQQGSCWSARSPVTAFVVKAALGIDTENNLVALPDFLNSYAWLLDNTMVGFTTTNTFTPIANGNYRVVVTYKNCIDTSSVIAFVSNIPSELSANVAIFPNPARKLLALGNLKSEQIQYSINDVRGRKVMEGILLRNLPEIDIASLPNGVYLLKIMDIIGKYPHYIRFVKN